MRCLKSMEASTSFISFGSQRQRLRENEPSTKVGGHTAWQSQVAPPIGIPTQALLEAFRILLEVRQEGVLGEPPFGPPGRTGAGYRIDWRGEVLRMEPQYTCTPSRDEGMDRRRGISGDPHRADCIPPLGCAFGAMVIRCSHSTNRGLISPAASPALSGTEPNRVAETMASIWETVPLRARSTDPQRPAFAHPRDLIGKAIQFQGEAPPQSTTRWRPCRPSAYSSQARQRPNG